ncbi:MAG TPA: ATP-binding protein, partial [Candidatus Thermoplasmatota archaeon]|nr:ATP-binding protein [Candidatus Thermoplasmatota archaeon]
AKRRLERQLEARNRQHAAVARLGQLALSERDLPQVLDAAVREAAQALDVEFCKILQLRPGGDLLLRAGTGWRPGLVGTLTIAAGLESQAGYTLQSGGSVIATDLATETRFHPTPLLMEHGVVSGMGVAIDGPERPYGVLSVHTARRREFNEDDIHFLQSIAHLLATAIERNHVEAQLRQHRESLEAAVAQRTGDLLEAVRELEAFSYTVSHDLRTPLRAIDGYSRLLLLRNADELSPAARQMLEAIGDQAIRMGRLIESILVLSRISRADLDRKPLDLGGMATEILRQLAQECPERRVGWAIEPGLVAEGDQELVRLALENLLGNAWKFTSRTPAARIRLRRVGNAFCVEDNGAGFDMAHAGQLFQPFHRLHAATEFDGTGIGLATVARIVRRHGGRIWAESRPNEGARFYFELAKSAAEPEPIAATQGGRVALQTTLLDA